MIYFYANDIYMGTAKLTPYAAQEIIKELNIISKKHWSYKRG